MSGVVDPDVCPTCGNGKVEGSTVSLPNECCAIYFYGEGSWAHGQWRVWRSNVVVHTTWKKPEKR